MSALSLSLACGDYDTLRAVLDGRVRPEGIDLIHSNVTPAELFWRQLRHEEFDVTELSLSNYIMDIAHGRSRFMAIPVFPHREFRHSCLWVRSDGGLERPEDLRGKRVGIPEYTMTMQLFLRGTLEHDYGVRPEEIEWVRVRPERVEFQPKARIVAAPPDSHLEDLLLAGEVDALITTETPAAALGPAPRARRLWHDVRAVEQDYYRRTAIFPIMHLIAVRRPIYEANRWIAANLMSAFEQSRRLAFTRLLGSDAQGAPVCSLPWLKLDLEEEAGVFGGELFVNGIAANMATLRAATTWSHEQGLSPRLVAVEELFAPEVVDGWTFHEQQ